MRLHRGRWALGIVAVVVLLSPPAGNVLAREAEPAQRSALPGKAAPPTDEEIRQALAKAHRAFRGEKSGKNADYIPALAKVNPALYGIALVTVDGRAHQVGDAAHAFSIQSIAKAFTAARAMDALGPAAIEKKIGVGATGMPFNSIIA